MMHRRNPWAPVRSKSWVLGEEKRSNAGSVAKLPELVASRVLSGPVLDADAFGGIADQHGHTVPTHVTDRASRPVWSRSLPARPTAKASEDA
jgi:hypothetical protein